MNGCATSYCVTQYQATAGQKATILVAPSVFGFGEIFKKESK